MDIFEKIDDEQQTISRINDFNIVEENCTYGYVFVRDESKIDIEFQEYAPVDKSIWCKKTGFFASHRAKKLYKILTETSKKGKPLTERQQQKRLKTIEKLLKKGVNIREYFSTGMDRTLLAQLPESEIKLLYMYGYDVEYALESSVDIDCYRKNIYFAFKDFERVGLLRNMPAEILEKVIHTRNGVTVSKDLIDSLVRGNYYYYSKALLENLQLLLKTGQIRLNPEQMLCLHTALKDNSVKILPETQAIFDLISIQGKLPEKKYTTQKQVSKHRTTTTKKSKQSEAQEVIDKLFEDAQNAVE